MYYFFFFFNDTPTSEIYPYRHPLSLPDAVPISARGHRGEVRLTHGESTRLVDHQRVDLFERLQSLGVANENAVLGALAGPGHDRHRRCEAECAWTGNDENGDRVNKCIGKRGEWPPDCPDDEGNDRDHDHRRHEPGRDLIGQTLDRDRKSTRLNSSH